MIEDLLAVIVQHWIVVLVTFTTAYLARNRYYHGLNKFPGPFAASLTDWWRFWDVWSTYRPDITQRALHGKHGDIVRIGPNDLIFANPEAVKTIYGLGKPFQKVCDPLRIALTRACA